MGFASGWTECWPKSFAADRVHRGDVALADVLRAMEKDILVDGKVDFHETEILLNLARPLAAFGGEYAAFRQALEDVREDGVVTADESARIASLLKTLIDRPNPYLVKHCSTCGRPIAVRSMSETCPWCGAQQGEAAAVYDARTLGLPRMGVLGVQHMFAMFGATILVPILTGLSPSATLLWAGIGTLLFHVITKCRVPAFLGSSFAYLAGYFALTGLAGTKGYEALSKGTALQYACIGVAASSIAYFVVSALVRGCGVKRVMAFFPPVVTGPIIIGIGLVLAPVAVNSCEGCWPVSIVAIATVLVCSIFGKGMVRIVPILLGVIASYLSALVFGLFGWADKIDYSNVAKAAWVGLPIAWENTVFPVFSNLDTGLLVTSLAVVVPLAFATIMEHVGDISAISSTVNRNFFENPGLHRTMLGDGVATALASLCGAPANTTYGENTGVLSLSKVYDPRVIRIAACLAILVSFCPKFSAFIGTIPSATIGGVSFVLYGMISAVGVRNLVEQRVDLSKSRNMLIAAIMLVLTLGIAFSKAGAVKFAVAGVNFALSGLAVGAITGIILNAILPGKDYSFSKDAAGMEATAKKPEGT